VRETTFAEGSKKKKKTKSPVLKVPRQCLFALLVEVMGVIRINVLYDAGKASLGRNFDVTVGK
jgi:hypothetical protein